MSIPQCAQTVLCDRCKELDCKFNTSGVPVRTQVSECEHINATQAQRPVTPQVRVHKSKPRAQEGTAMGNSTGTAGKGKREATRVNVIAFILGGIAYVKANSEYTGMHVKLSGFNAAFRNYFGVERDEGITLVDDAIEHAKADDGKIELFFTRMARGGPIIWLMVDKPVAKAGVDALDSKAKGMLASIK